MIGNCVLSYKNAPRGCALGAKVDGCRSNRASARECAKAHSFSYDRKFLHSEETILKMPAFMRAPKQDDY